MELSRLQAAVSEWSRYNFGEDRPSYRTLLGAAEELGELCHAHLKSEQGIREGLDPIKIKSLKADAIADIIIYLTDYCVTENIDLSHTVASTWWEVSKRDWKKFPENGNDR